MRRMAKTGITWLLLALLLAEGCVMPVSEDPDVRKRVPSPTSALSEEFAGPIAGGASSEGIQLQFTEIRSSGDLDGAYAGCEGADWFELYNAGTRDVDLGSLYITNDPQKPDKHQLPKYVLQPGHYVAVCCCGDPTHPSVAMGIARRGETLFIYGGDRREICTITVPPLDADISWAYRDGAWGYCMEPTPGSANGRIFVSLDPMKVDSLGLTVSELMIDGKNAPILPDGSYCDFVEFCNDTDDTLSMKNWYLSDREDDLEKWSFPDVQIAPGEYLLVLLGGDGQPRADGLLQADFSVNRREQVVLYNANTLTYATFDLPKAIRSDVSVGAHGEYYLTPTPGRVNGLASYTAEDKGCYDYTGVFISEVCAYAGAGSNDWIELYNATDRQVSLEGWRLLKGKDGEKVISLSGILIPGGYAVFETTSHPER